MQREAAQRAPGMLATVRLMYNGKTILGLIPARGGSKSVVRKNIRSIHGKPLIAWTIEEARRSQFVDRIIISTDYAEIAEISKLWHAEVPFIRPAALAQDETPMIAVVSHALTVIKEKYDYVVVLQPTSPLRLASDIDACIEFCLTSGAPACVSVAEAEESPYLMYSLSADGRMRPLLSAADLATRRQNLPRIHILNGAIYLARCNWLAEHQAFVTADTLAYEMPGERSLDIDNEIDLRLSEILLSERER